MKVFNLNFFRKRKVETYEWPMSNEDMARYLHGIFNNRSEKDRKEIVYYLARKEGHYISKNPVRKEKRGLLHTATIGTCGSYENSMDMATKYMDKYKTK